ncbi:MBOAT family O-acyltransferase [Plebeiibacterium marinum]|uniref:Uncharacterized protein n=1 Tax=Plebeiibacterium marinum TaxID=2992111 RepID=A0AAE3SMB8_9BACT|nr:MBOAT family O-acyltransferase [Plebeiobacterium marinum]MCW3807385.1 hypothetical protein [Plebeiobacterium marinum]
MLTLIGFSYASGIIIENGYKKVGILLSVIPCLGALVYFKYANFLLSNINQLFSYTDHKYNFNSLNIILPVGISFYVFQSLSYTFDVYNKTVKANRSFLSLATYISLFPQLIAGPIVRYKDISKQLISREITTDKITKGIERFIIGLAKKAILANSCAVIADILFSASPDHISTGAAWIGAIAYSCQIYFDFSAYSDMAIGLGNMFGFKFLENFNYPYISLSIREFWRRWHISLSTWFRDYLYIPIGGNRISKKITFRNLIIVFVITGLWHGASWNFILWGLFHGLFIIIERHVNIDKYLRNSLIKRLYTIIVIIIGWVIFRSQNISHAIDYISCMFNTHHDSGILYHAKYFLNAENILILSLCVILSTPVFPLLKSKFDKHPLNNNFSVIYYFCLFILLFICISYISAGTYNPFIYFRF